MNSKLISVCKWVFFTAVCGLGIAFGATCAHRTFDKLTAPKTYQQGYDSSYEYEMKREAEKDSDYRKGIRAGLEAFKHDTKE